MRKSTINKLNNLNKIFYSVQGQDFSDSREYFWKGWSRLLETLNFKIETLKILDVGCGNGRFAEFLVKNNIDFEYTGIDFSQKLLDIADERLERLGLDYGLKNVDLLQDWRLDQKYDLIVVFGVLHHIAGEENRQKFFDKCKALLSKQGLLVVTVWQFPLFDRFDKKILPKEEILEKTGINPSDLEDGDYILDWNRNNFGLRYANYSDRAQIQRFINNSGIKLVEKFEADGREGKINRYYLINN